MASSSSSSSSSSIPIKPFLVSTIPNDYEITTWDVNPNSPEKRLNAIIEPFGLTFKTLSSLLDSTSAVLSGSAVTHFLQNETPKALSESSDLDFWVYNPEPSGINQGFHSIAFSKLVKEKFLSVFKPLGYNLQLSPPSSHEHIASYERMEYIFRTKAEIKLHVYWIVHRETGKYMNLVFSNAPVSRMIRCVDIPICRAFIFSDYAGLRTAVAYDPVVLKDLKDGLLTPPVIAYSNKTTDKRVKKYLERFSLSLRPVAVPAPAPAPVADPDSVASVAPAPAPVADSSPEPATVSS